jgi:hypothetical protein
MSLRDAVHELADAVGLTRLHAVIDEDKPEEKKDDTVKTDDDSVRSGDSVTVEKEGEKDEDD